MSGAGFYPYDGGTSGSAPPASAGTFTFDFAAVFTGNVSILPLPIDAADDAAAALAGVAVGQVYRNGSVLMIRIT